MGREGETRTDIEKESGGHDEWESAAGETGLCFVASADGRWAHFSHE